TAGPGGGAYTFRTLAGTSAIGSTDGPASSARFFNPSGVAVDGDGNIYVADSGNNTIRKITAGGIVTTLAWLAGTCCFVDGTGSGARFSSPRGVAVDSAGTVYVADANNSRIRKITPAGVVTTLAGGTFGTLDGTGTGAQFNSPQGLVVD